MGEQLADRMEFEELALKGIDPSLGPQVQAGTLTSMEQKAQIKVSVNISPHPAVQCLFLPQIPLIHPASINSSSKTLDELRALVASRTPRHRKGFFLWMGIAPFTIPFTIIRVLPCHLHLSCLIE